MYAYNMPFVQAQTLNMTNNPYRQVKDGDSLEESNGFYDGAVSTTAASNGHLSSIAESLTQARKSEEMLANAPAVGRPDVDRQGHASGFDGISEGHEPAYLHTDLLLSDKQETSLKNGTQAQPFRNGFAVQLPQQQHQLINSSTISSAHTRDGDVDTLPGAIQGLQIQQYPESMAQHGHAHVPSFSQVRKESLPQPRPIYVRALSSQITEVQVTQTAPGEAHAEVLRRLGKAERSVKTLKRRGSNESLSSLISYSIRRPSIPARPESGYSLDALATVLKDVAQEGNLALVEAVMALGANPNFRSVNRLKNRRHDALSKATAAGHVDVIDYLIRQGAIFASSDSIKKDVFTPIDLKLLDVAYSGYGEVARYLISSHNANPFIEQWPREYFDANRTVYRRVVPAKVFQRTVLDAIARIGNADQDMNLLVEIMSLKFFDPTAITTRAYEDTPYSGDGSRMTQTIYQYSALSSFVKAGWADAVERMLEMENDPSQYEKQEQATFEEGQIPSANFQRYIYPANALTKDTWMYKRQDALRILKMIINQGFNLDFAQRTADDSAPRTILSRAILANAAEGVEMLLKAKPDLVKQDVSFRLLLNGGKEQEYKAQPLAAAIIQGSLETARIILRNGASPRDPAFSYPNVLQFAAGHGGTTAAAILADMTEEAPDLLIEALETAIQRLKPDAVHVLLHSTAAKNVSSRRLYDMVLSCKDTSKDDDAKRRYMQIVDLINRANTQGKVPRPNKAAFQTAIESGNAVGDEKL